MLDKFDLLLLDLNGTFMFDQDRFGPEESYFETYVKCGGIGLSEQEVDVVVNEVVSLLESVAGNPDRFNSFPSVFESLLVLNVARKWPVSELELVEHVVALHELGSISSDYAEIVLKLHSTHKLGLVCNLWSKKTLWINELHRSGLGDCFEWLVFSSDGVCTKPSRRIFDSILSHWGGDLRKTVMIGDSLQRDVLGAHNSGIEAIWIKQLQERANDDPVPDYVIDDLADLKSS